MRVGLAVSLGPRFGKKPFTPQSLFAGTAGAWYDPSDLSSMFQDSAGTTAAAVDSPVGRINDKSGNGNHATQATAAARPILRQDGSGRLYLEFDGVDDELRASFAIAQPWDRISAIRQITRADFDRIFGGATANAGNLLQHPTSPQIYALSGDTTGIVATSVPPLGTNMTVTERHAATGARLGINADAYFTGNTGTTLPGGIALGGGGPVGLRFSNIRLYGVVMIGRPLSDSETSQLRSFMAGKAGVTL
jgi:hypothetical protein